MTNNEILRRLREHLNLQDDSIIRIFKHSDFILTKAQLKALLKPPLSPGFLKCKDTMLIAFLDGLITFKRGPSNKSESLQNGANKELKKKTSPYLKISNNTILKKLRIAYKYHDQDMLKIFLLAEYELGKSELSAWFRKEGHKNYKVCPDEVLEKFFIGLEKYFKSS